MYENFGEEYQECIDKKGNINDGNDRPFAVGDGAFPVRSGQPMNKFFQFMSRIKRSISWKKIAFWLVLFFLVCSVVGFVGMAVLFVVYSKDLPTPNKVVRRDGFASQMYDRNGALLYDVYKDAKRTPVVWEDVPDYLKKATIATEDKDFYKHQGFDPLTPLRMVKNLIVLHQLTGGSTLTQQLVKNVLLTSDRSVTRKIKEFILAVQIERKYTKDEILLMYLNEAPYGGAAWGVGTAAQQYFGKDVKELTLEECAILAGLPQRPNVYSPFSKTPKAYVARTYHVLERMKEDGYITANLESQAKPKVADYQFRTNQSTIAAPHFVFWVKDQLIQRYGEDAVEGGGLKITTTLDLDMQHKVEDIMSSEVDKAEKLGISNGAAVVMDPTNGEVLAMQGSRDYYSTKTDGKFNVVTQALRQPGSAIKPVTYLTAIKKGYTASTMVMDTPVTFPGTGGQKDYSPQNYTGKYNGPMSIRNALGNSINTVAVKTLANVGIENMLQTAYDMGLSTLEPTKENMQRFGLAVTLGGAEVKMIDLAAAYGAFANQGQRFDAVGVLKVVDRSGRVLEEYKPMPGKQVITPQEAFIISNILADNSARQLTFGAVNGLIVPNYQVAVKTGTTNDKRDNWAIGWTPNILVAAWVGNNDNSPMTKVASGVSGATPIWRQIMAYAVSKRPKQDFPIPDKIVSMDVDNISGYAAHDGFPSHTDYFIDGTQPKVDDPIHTKLKVCKSGQAGLAPPEDVAAGNYDEREYYNFQEDDPISKDGINRWQQGIDQWISQQSNQDQYHPPTNYCRSGGLVDVGIDSPAHQSTVGNTFDVNINTHSLYKITEVKLWIDGTEYKTWTERPFQTSVTLANGPHVIKVRATDKEGNSQDREADIGVNVPWNYSPTPTTSITPAVGVTPTPTMILSPTPSLIPTVHP